MKTTLHEEHRQLRIACSEATKRLNQAAKGLRRLLKVRSVISETPQDVKVMMQTAVEAISESLRQIHAV